MSHIIKITTKCMQWHEYLISLRIVRFHENAKSYPTVVPGTVGNVMGMSHSWRRCCLCQILCYPAAADYIKYYTFLVLDLFAVPLTADFLGCHRNKASVTREKLDVFTTTSDVTCLQWY